MVNQEEQSTRRNSQPGGTANREERRAAHGRAADGEPVVSLPRLVVAAPASGHGKTTIATGLMAALRERGLTVSGHKAGPDYIDPGYHALATGRPGRNLDPVLCGADLMAPLLLHGATGADIAVIEGVMGLYDGRGATGEGSTAHVAALLRAPVLLVVDAAAQGRSVAALVTGFAAYDRSIRIGGVVLNRVGSDRHEEILRTALAETGIPVLGTLRRDDAVAVPSRHLGLIPVAERQPAASAVVRRLAALIGRSVDLDAVVALARTAAPLTAPAWEPPAPAVTPRAVASSATTDQGRPPRPRPVVAVAGGAAFTFGYAETGELLAAAGADVVTVDPLRDESLPPGTAALVIGGGFPEEYAAELSANARLRAEVARLAASGAPVIAECAGLLYLSRELDGAPMCGVLPATARMTSRLTLGYRDAIAAGDSVLGPAGLAVRGHEFHRTTVSPAASAPAAWTLDGRNEGFVQSAVHASYLHLHWAGQPGIAARVVDAARRTAKTATEAA
jgi:cobyrinic acid a,c-diamide synthase